MVRNLLEATPENRCFIKKMGQIHIRDFFVIRFVVRVVTWERYPDSLSPGFGIFRGQICGQGMFIVPVYAVLDVFSQKCIICEKNGQKHFLL